MEHKKKMDALDIKLCIIGIQHTVQVACQSASGESGATAERNRSGGMHGACAIYQSAEWHIKSTIPS